MAGVLFCLAGLIMALSALISGNTVPNIPIAMMFVCVGLALSNSSNRRRK